MRIQFLQDAIDVLRKKKPLFKRIKVLDTEIDAIIEQIKDKLKKHNNLSDFYAKTLSLIAKNHENKYADNDYIPKFSEKRRKVWYVVYGQNFLEEYLPKIKEFEYLYNMLEDKDSKELFCQLVAFRILGGNKIKLPLYDQKLWQQYHELRDSILEKVGIPAAFDQMHIYDIKKLGFDLKILCGEFGIFTIFILEQYRYKNLVKVQSGDYVIDGGGCYGDTALYFSELAGKDGKVFAFEFNEENVTLFNRNLELNPKNKKRITIIQNPLSHRSDMAVGIHKSGAGSRVVEASDEQNSKYKTISIDDFVTRNKIQKIDFIKLDIEGAEFDTINGARRVIENFKPKLAISIYHKPDDFITIPRLIKEVNPNYKFYLGHFTVQAWETVLFAIDDK